MSIIEKTTEDMVLGGRVRLQQPASGYRVAIDPILLAAAVPLAPGERIADLGCGVGAAALCLLARAREAAGAGWAQFGTHVMGLEREPLFLGLARRNAVLNGFETNFEPVAGEVQRLAAVLPRGEFDQVLCNPPYLAQGAHQCSPITLRAAANSEGDARIESWIDAALSLLRPRGRLTLIHRADRLDRVVAALEGAAGEIRIFPLWPRSGLAARRVIVSARKNVRGPSLLSGGLALHDAQGGYTSEAEAILRGGREIAWI